MLTEFDRALGVVGEDESRDSPSTESEGVGASEPNPVRLVYSIVIKLVLSKCKKPTDHKLCTHTPSSALTSKQPTDMIW